MICQHCKQEFTPVYVRQFFCTSICKDQARITKINNKWANSKDPKKKTINVDTSKKYYIDG